MKHFVIFVCCSLAFVFSSCVKNNDKPVWLSIGNWTLDPSTQPMDDIGQLTHNFSDVWVYVDNKVIGVFELPCKIPVLASGNVKVQLYPAIRNNGISATKKIYPFVKGVEMQMDLVPGQTYEFTPHTQYSDNVKCWKEDFSSNSFQIQTQAPPSNAAIVLGNDPDYALNPGNQYAQIHLTPTDSLWVGFTTEPLYLYAGKEIYLEIDYRNTAGLLTGVLGILTDNSVQQNPDILLNAQDPATVKWKKIYIDLKEIVSYSTNAAYFQLFLQAALSNEEGDVFIDNIKVVRFY